MLNKEKHADAPLFFILDSEYSLLGIKSQAEVGKSITPTWNYR